MKRRLLLLFVTVLLIAVSELIPLLHGEIHVGVKEGDWIEYSITHSKTPPSKYATWARIEILSVQGAIVLLEVKQRISDGTQETDRETVNLETGQLGDGFLIPANLSAGDTFLEAHEDELIIGGVQELIYAGENRTIVYTTTIAGIWWDRATGILLEARYSQMEYSTVIKADRTSLWGTGLFVNLDPILLYILILVALLVVAALAIFFIFRRRRTAT